MARDQCLGLPELIAMLKKKLEKENGIRGREVMVTAGANMAFVHAAMCLASPGDAAILFAPYYFSHRVALELLGVKPIYVECDDEMMPSATELAAALERAEAFLPWLAAAPPCGDGPAARGSPGCA